jgi:hypothetical protein
MDSLDLRNIKHNSDLKTHTDYEEFRKCLADSLNPLEGILETYKKQMFEPIEKITETFSKMVSERITPVLESVAKMTLPLLNIDFNAFRINMFKMAFNEHNDLVNELYEKTIFAPIYYIAEKDIKRNEIIDNLDEWILSSDVKNYYLDRIKEWKNNYNDNSALVLIDEIYSNLKIGNYFSISMLIFVLIEYMLRQGYFVNNDTVKYREIRDILKEKAFDVVGISNIYEKFIQNNLYANTNKAQEFSRHIAHGVKLEFGTEKTAMNMIFIYDYIQEILDIKQNKAS